MISVQNHLPPLNGNRMNFIYVCITIFFIACSPKTIPANKPLPSPQIGKTIQDTLKEYAVLPVDTIIWNDISGSVKPITVPEVKEIIKPKIVGKSGKTEWKETYHLKLFIPLNSDHYQVSNLVNNRFVQYYAGILLALEDLETEGANINLEVVDTEMSTFQASQAINDITPGSVDVIIGPFEREDLKTMATGALEKKITLISPWQTSTKIASQNEYYIQLKPNLKDHFKKIVEHVVSNHSYDNIAVITHQNQDGNAWFSFMNDVAKNLMGSQYSLKHIAVSKDSLISPNTAFVNLFNNNPPQVVILPYYSFNDEDKLYSVVRRLSADKGTNQLIVYGMPLLLDSDRIDFEYYSSMQMRIAISDFIDENDYKVKEFKLRFFNLFGEIPTPDALKGYDMMMFTGRNLVQHGNFFQSAVTGELQTYTQSEFELQKTYQDDNENIGTDAFDYYENKRIAIIQFRNNGFERID